MGNIESDDNKIVVGNKVHQKNLADLASASGVTLEFIDNPN